jgi:hypothetical protein
MDKNKFKTILFKVAFCTMACDGDIDEREIEEIKKMDKVANYFEDIDLSSELENLISSFKINGIGIIVELFDEIKELELNPIQELLILEVSIRIIYADKRIDDNEIKFFRFLRSKLRIPNSIISDRFGDINELYDTKQDNNIVYDKTIYEFTKSIKIPELVQVDLNIDKSE